MTGKLRVVAVDDETGLADLYAAWLEDGYEVTIAYGGKAALEAVDADTDISSRTGGCHSCPATKSWRRSATAGWTAGWRW